MVSVISPQTPHALPMTGVILALPGNHWVGGSLENLILKISSRVNGQRCLWDKFLLSMIRYRLNVTIDGLSKKHYEHIPLKDTLKSPW